MGRKTAEAVAVALAQAALPPRRQHGDGGDHGGRRGSRPGGPGRPAVNTATGEIMEDDADGTARPRAHGTTSTTEKTEQDT